MNKIRINELARELEVKAHEILDRLPELGVTEKKTHSSSIDEDVAIKLRRIFGGGAGEPSAEPEARAATPAETPAAPVATPTVTEGTSAGPTTPQAPAGVEDKAAEPATARIAERPAGRPASPIRPPLAGAHTPSTVSTRPQAPVPPPSLPMPPRVAQTPPAAVIAPGRPTPTAARPVPAPRPGQVLSGPRQPMPAGLNDRLRHRRQSIAWARSSTPLDGRSRPRHSGCPDAFCSAAAGPTAGRAARRAPGSTAASGPGGAARASRAPPRPECLAPAPAVR